MKLSKELLETIVYTSKAVSNNISTFSMSCVRVSFNNEGRATVVATDGHILSETTLETLNEVKGIEYIAFNKEDVNKLKGLLKNCKYAKEFDLERKEDKYLLGSTHDTILLSNPEVDFPKYESVIRVRSPGPVKMVTLNMELLKKLTDSLGKTHRRAYPVITLVIGEDSTALIRVVRGDGRDTAIQRAGIMPIRNDGHHTLAKKLGIEESVKDNKMTEDSKATYMEAYGAFKKGETK